ncbi:MAG: diguanylate cyclase [Thermomicrobiales bacterium]
MDHHVIGGLQASEIRTSILADAGEQGKCEQDTFLEGRAKAWYAIHFEEIVDSVLVAIRPHIESEHPVAFVRTIIHGHLSGIVSAIFSPPMTPLFIRGVGLEIAEFCLGSASALTDFRLALTENIIGYLPEDIRADIAARFEPILTEIIWGYAVTGAEVERDQSIHPPLQEDSSYRLEPEWYEELFQQSPLAIGVFDVTIGKMLAGNRRLEEMFGYSLAEFDAVPNEELLGPESPDGDHDVANDLMAGRIPHFQRVGAFRHRDGHMVWFQTMGWLTRDDDGKPVQMVYSYAPLPSKEDDEQHWQRADRRFRYLAQLSSDPTFIVGHDGSIRYASPGTERSLGIEPELLLGIPFCDLAIEPDRDHLIEFRAKLEAWPRQTLRTEIRLLRRDGQSRWFELTGANLLDVPDIEGFSMQARDITDRKLMESLLVEQAVIDPLTRLLNRRGILEHIEHALLRAEDVNEKIALLYIDLDGFKNVNDLFGHQVGDDVLATIGSRLAKGVNGRCVAGRMGGDEFVVLLEDATRERAVAIANELHEQLTAPIEVDGHLHRVNASIGVAIFETGSETAESLIRAADAALYRAKAIRDGVPVVTNWDAD